MNEYTKTNQNSPEWPSMSRAGAPIHEESYARVELPGHRAIYVPTTVIRNEESRRLRLPSPDEQDRILRAA